MTDPSLARLQASRRAAIGAGDHLSAAYLKLVEAHSKGTGARLTPLQVQAITAEHDAVALATAAADRLAPLPPRDGTVYHTARVAQRIQSVRGILARGQTTSRAVREELGCNHAAALYALRALEESREAHVVDFSKTMVWAAR